VGSDPKGKNTMKTITIIRTALLLGILLAACSPGGTVKPPAATATQAVPQAAFASPAAGETLPGGKINVVVQATSSGGVARIELLINGNVVANGENQDPAQTYFVLAYEWEPPTGGDYTLEARAQSKAGVWGEMTTITVRVEAGPPAEEPTAEPTAEPTLTPTPAVTAEPTLTPTGVVGGNATATATQLILPTATNSGVTLTLQIWGTRLYVADSACEPQTLLFMATPSDKDRVAGVYMAFRLRDPDSADKRGWSKGTPLNPAENGKYYIYLTTRYFGKPLPWLPGNVDYQFYALDRDGNVLYLSEIFRDMQILVCKK
jgi:hypothetical protein